jgi:hypothetical protein
MNNLKPLGLSNVHRIIDLIITSILFIFFVGLALIIMIFLGFIEQKPGGSISKGAFIIIIICIIGVFLVNYLKKIRYYRCPYCDCSILVKTDWTCDYCKNSQGEDRLITLGCKHCGRELETAFCEHCHREFKL